MESIVELCRTTAPSVVYVAIGCANSAEQEYPPFLANWAEGNRLLVWIDPTLEDPPLATTGADTVVCRRHHFHWDTDDARSFIYGLCALALEGGLQVVVQDYTGRDIRPLYPVEAFGPALLSRVLFDVTYGDGGCTVDFERVAILRDADGGFFQPAYVRLDEAPVLAGSVLNERYAVLTEFVWTLYLSKTGRGPARDWCTPEIVAARSRRLLFAYRITDDSASVTANRQLLVSALEDFSAVAGAPMSADECAAVVESGEVPSAFALFRAMAVGR